MAENEYRKKLREWMDSRRQAEVQRTQEKPYDPGKMRSRMPLGCAVLAVVAILMAIYWFFVKSGFLSRFLF